MMNGCGISEDSGEEQTLSGKENVTVRIVTVCL